MARGLTATAAKRTFICDKRMADKITLSEMSGSGSHSITPRSRGDLYFINKMPVSMLYRCLLVIDDGTR